MNILVIKQTSLGDVLHATGHVRTIKEHFPKAKVTLLTATTSLDIFRHNPYVDEIIAFDRYKVKYDWWRRPRWVVKHISDVIAEVRRQPFDMVFDLQGRWKSALFMYAARTGKRYVKGRWWFAKRFHKPELHALEEMDGVLELAGMNVKDHSMTFATSEREVTAIDTLLETINPENKRLLILSPFTRWATKNWSLERFQSFLELMPPNWLTVFTGAAGDRWKIQQMLEKITPYSRQDSVNLLGKLSLLEFAELINRAACVISGDSFPMHVACAQKTPVIALFGPTDESRVGPVGDFAHVLRANNCERCYQRKNCRKNCIDLIRPDEVLERLTLVVA